MLNQTEKDLVYLLRCSMHEKPVEREIADLEEVVKLAQKHSVAAMAVWMLPGTNPYSQIKDKSIVRVARLQNERKIIEDDLSKKEIWHMALKGSVLYSLYPSVGMREMCDVDILYDKTKIDEVNDIMKKRGYVPEEKENGADRAYHKAPYSFEMHHDLFGKAHRAEFERYYNCVEVKLVGDIEKSFIDEDFYIYMVAHGAKHYEDLGGTGLRTILDTYVFCSQKNLDWHYIEEEISILGITTYEKVSRSLGMKLFGEDNPNGLTKAEEEMFEYIMRSGTYGTLKHHVAKKGGRWNYLSRLIFIQRNQCQGSYPFFYDHPLLLPCLWIYRVGRAATVNRKEQWHRLKTILRSGK